MDKQDYEEMTSILTNIINKQHESAYGICGAIKKINWLVGGRV